MHNLRRAVMVKTLEHTLPSQCAKFISEAGFPVRVKDTGRHINISEDQKAGSLFSDLSGHTLRYTYQMW